METWIVSLCYYRNDIAEDVYWASRYFAKCHVSLTTYIGYMAWAPKLVALSFRYPWLYRFLLKPVGVHWANHAAYRVNMRQSGDRLGMVFHGIGASISFIIGKGIREYRKCHMRFQAISARF